MIARRPGRAALAGGLVHLACRDLSDQEVGNSLILDAEAFVHTLEVPMQGSCCRGLSARRIARPTVALVLAAALLAVPIGRCLGQDQRPYLTQYNTQVAQGQYPEAEQTARAGLDIATRSNHEESMWAWLLLLGEALRQQRKLADAETAYTRSRDLLVKLHGANHSEVGTIDYSLAVVYREMARHDKAELLFKQAISFESKSLGPEHEKVANGLNGLARLYQEQSRFTEAEAAFRRALAIYARNRTSDGTSTAMTLNNLGLTYTEVGRFTEAEEILRRALAIRKTVLGPDHPFTGAVHTSLGHLYSDEGRFDVAEREYRNALASTVKAFGPESPWVASILGGLGNLLNRQSRHAEAEKAYERALAINERTLAADHPEIGLELTNLASTLIDTKQYTRAEPLLRRALAIRQKALGPDDFVVASTWHNLGFLEMERDRPELAEPLLRQALAIYEKAYGPDHPKVCNTLAQLARAARARGDMGEARRLLDRAISSGAKAAATPGARSRHFLDRAELSWQDGRRDAALDDLRAAIRSAEDARGQSSGADRERATLFADFARAYERMVQWQAELGGVAEALDALERSRARSLLDEMATAGYDLQAGRPPQERLRIERDGAAARERVARLEKQLAAIEADPARRSETKNLRGQLAEAQEALYQHERDTRASSPVYRELLNRGARPPALEEIRRQLCSGDGVVLEYLVGEDGGYVVAVGTGFARLTRLELTSDDATALGVEPGPLHSARLRAVLAGNRGQRILSRLSDPTAEAPVKALAVLWRVLIPEDVRKGLTDGTLKRLTVVPDGPLATLPFEALVVETGDAPKYLLDVGPPIAYAPSATVLISLAGRNAAANRPDREPVLALGDPAYPQGATAPAPAGDSPRGAARARYSVAGGALARLPFSGWEAQWVTKAFSDAGVKAVSLSGTKATEAAVRYWAPGRKVLHLACHGLADQTLGNFYGGLAVAPGPRADSDPADDGFLQLAEICALDLKGSELAVLSACQTNFGPQQTGEGTWSLSRGFLVAGARRVVASNWLVDDEAAASLISVYSTLLAKAEKDGKPADYAAALRDAKRWVRAKEKWNSPYYWSTLVLVGPP